MIGDRVKDKIDYVSCLNGKFLNNLKIAFLRLEVFSKPIEQLEPISRCAFCREMRYIPKLG